MTPQTPELPELTPAQDRALDALLHEHAKHQSQDDEAFLAEFETKLTSALEAPEVLKPDFKKPKKLLTKLLLPLGLAASVAVILSVKRSRDSSTGYIASAETSPHIPTAPLAKSNEQTNVRSRMLAIVEEAWETPSLQDQPSTRQAATEGNLGIKKQENIPVDGLRPSAAPVAENAELWDDASRRAEFKSDLTASRYEAAPQNPFLSPTSHPLSTFSIDVDTASYSNIRKMLQNGQTVPPAAVRVEEMLNYFSYTYPQPQGEHPFSVGVESSACPWNTAHRLVKIGLQAKDVDRTKRPASNLVFLVDVSGSMSGPDRLGLVTENLKVMTQALQPDDTVAIVVYSGNEGLALPPTSGADKATILAKLDSLSAGGSTNGAGGIKLAYSTARSRFLKEGINRVVLCTDGDFNVGVTSQSDLLELVKTEAADGIFLTVCGYGQGNLNDAMLEAITNNGNGIYHYIDSEREGRKVFQDELLGTLLTVAKDVKLQIEFNPNKVASYRLVGYENRLLAKEDFANDKVDAGDLGAGHRVTALYEVVPPGAPELAAAAGETDLKYQKSKVAEAPGKPAQVLNDSGEMLTVKLRYKQPKATESVPFAQPFTEDATATAGKDLQFAGVVAEFGQRLRGTLPKTGRSLQQLIDTANEARGDDPHGLRAEFIELMRTYSKTQH
jgi:Ca-activated chloride channel homolog